MVLGAAPITDIAATLVRSLCTAFASSDACCHFSGTRGSKWMVCRFAGAPSPRP